MESADVCGPVPCSRPVPASAGGSWWTRHTRAWVSGSACWAGVLAPHWDLFVLPGHHSGCSFLGSPARCSLLLLLGAHVVCAGAWQRGLAQTDFGDFPGPAGGRAPAPGQRPWCIQETRSLLRVASLLPTPSLTKPRVPAGGLIMSLLVISLPPSPMGGTCWWPWGTCILVLTVFAPTFGCPLLGGRPRTPSPCCQTMCVPGQLRSGPQGQTPGSGPCLLPPPQVAVGDSARLWGPWPVPASRGKSPVLVPAFSWRRLWRTGFWSETPFCPLSGTGWRPCNSSRVSTTTFQFVECSFHFTLCLLFILERSSCRAGIREALTCRFPAGRAWLTGPVPLHIWL